MSTNDVPGANPINNDALAMGCWAENPDGSLLFVESTEGGRVIYCLFDPVQKLQYRDAMPTVSFKSTFSWRPADPKSVKWTWHDKTAFPWQRVIDGGFPDGQDHASAAAAISAADNIRASRRRHLMGGAGHVGLDVDRDLPARRSRFSDDPDWGDAPNLSAAGRVANELGLQAQAIDRSGILDRMDRTVSKLASVLGNLTAALGKLPGKGGSAGKSAGKDTSKSRGR